MKNFNPHTDLTNTRLYNNIQLAGKISREKQQELNQLYGAISIIHSGFVVNLKLNDTFELEDSYGNTLYIAKYNKKEEVFKLIDSNKFRLCSSIEEFDLIIRTYFKRKLP